MLFLWLVLKREIAHHWSSDCVINLWNDFLFFIICNSVDTALCYTFRYWAIAAPTYAMVTLVLVIVFYIGINFMVTPPPTSFNTIFGESQLFWLFTFWSDVLIASSINDIVSFFSQLSWCTFDRRAHQESCELGPFHKRIRVSYSSNVWYLH